MEPDFDPIVSKAPDEVPLERPPLVRVIAQVRFPMVTAVGKQEFIAPFQEAIRKTYSVLRVEQTQGIVLNPGAAPTLQAQTVWRFSDVDAKWRVSLAPDFLALETPTYTSRKDFYDRFKDVVRAVERHIQPSLVDRIGMRYINRITGDELLSIGEIVRPEIRGVVGSLRDLQHALCEANFKIEKYQLMARWGILPPNVTVDPSALEPLNERSWVLDLDMFSTDSMVFDTKLNVDIARSFAERIYAFFRWAMTDEFLRRRGGKI